MMEPIQVNRSEFLLKLQSVSAGLASNDKQVDQASCLLFRAGYVQTYNDETAVSMESGLPEDVICAVPAKKFMDLLAKLGEEEVGLEFAETEIIVHGRKGRASGFRIDAEITSGVDAIDQPTEWFELPEHFAEGISITQECAGNTSHFVTNVVNIHPKWIEAGDATQIIRFRPSREWRSGLQEPTMVRQQGIKHMTSLGMTEFAESESWLHFRNAQGLTYSCRRYIDPPYPSEDLTAALKAAVGERMALPKGLIAAADLAETILVGDKNGMVTIELETGRLRLSAVGPDGCWHTEPRKVSYEGEPLTFLISPKLLKEIVGKHNEAILCDDKLLVDGGKWRYLTVLGLPDEAQPQQEQESEQETAAVGAEE